MNTRIMRLMRLHRLCAPAGEGGSDAGGTGTAAAPTDAGTTEASASTLLTAEEPDAGSTADDGAVKPDGAADPADGEKKPEGEDKKSAVEGAPEQYADFAMPDGVALDPEMATEFKSVAKELNLPQDKAQRLADIGAKLVQKSGTQNAEVVKAARAEWSAAAQADKEFGGEEFKANLVYARKALDTFGTPELKQVLNGSGLGDHPEFIRFMYRAGKAVSADTYVPGGAAQAPKSDADVFYGGSPVSQPAR